MYFKECERLVKRHPDLADAVERIDAQLRAMGNPEALRAEDLASFLRLDPNQVSSILEELARAGLLLEEEVVECGSCQMAVLLSEYEEHRHRDGEYRCTGCDRPLQDRTPKTITTYRSGAKWDVDSVATLDPDAAGLDDAARRSNASPPMFTPTSDDLKILRELEKSRITLTFVAIHAATNISRKTVGKRAALFRQHGLVHEPHKHKGIALSSVGREFMKQFGGNRAPAPASSPQITH